MQKLFCDWGTSNLRAYLIENGEVLRQYNSDLGILKASKIGFEKVIASVCQELDCTGIKEIYLSGMIGSKNGWQEASYLETPLSTNAMKTNFIHPSNCSHIKIFGGVKHLDQSRDYDVMRGEEVQVFGVLVQAPKASLICLPGSHSKWVHVDAGQIKSFSTWMTGELFKCLSQNTIFAKQIDSENFDKESFVQGVEYAREHHELGTSLFKLRTQYLFERLDQSNFHSYLSGFLIASEIREAAGNVKEVYLCSSDELMNLYEIALDIFGIATKKFSVSESTILGIKAICGESYE
ncbi:2-dehydro-3-deoxygalactonokinase [Lentisphaera profundi]|uniref:2-dehydro-3-deoxygalactonokinase n=1 Tax=Lentisphaera profundi TaxID=1658616 RepID=A0ABY7W2M6_9BACT|nr:2-dehydro-3-deoxygalactonokinase [Lentisphaera profundi]WDE99251.1 2-dehydro-3-deoxygalactonokinase [Lentisphaera profundi]